MTEQLVIHRHDYDAGNQGLSWARIIGIAFVIALHLTALMIFLASSGFLTPLAIACCAACLASGMRPSECSTLARFK
ncbi:TonB protein [Xanthomonas citri pv. fuscans]|nr:TonB protein [Xanthomonas citri pv. fuscans]